MPWMHAVRDLMVVLATLALWHQDAALRGGAGLLEVSTAVAAGSWKFRRSSGCFEAEDHQP